MNHHHNHVHDHTHDEHAAPGEQPGRPDKGERGRPRRGGMHGPRRRRDPEFREAFFGPMGPDAFRRGGRPGPGRGRRGDVRNAVLALLAESPRNGYQIINEIGDRTDGLWRPSAGSVYPALGLLEDEGLIHKVDTDSRKAFALTEAGTAYVQEHAEELTDPWAKVAEPHEGYLNVRKETGQLALALHQVVIAGNPEQIVAARAALDKARTSIYRILAGDTPD